MSNRKLKLTELNRLTVEEFKSTPKNPVTVVLDNIRSMNNVGSVFRTSDAFAIENIYLCGITPQPPHRDIHKTAIGAEDAVLWSYHKETLDILKELRSKGYTIAAIEQSEKSISLQNFTWKNIEKLAIVMGNEVDGVQQEVIDFADMTIEIPQFGTKHSLNISVCTGVVLWDVISKYKF